MKRNGGCIGIAGAYPHALILLGIGITGALTNVIIKLSVYAEAHHDLSQATGKVKKLDLGPNQSNIFSGEVSGRFEVAAPFKFEGA